MQKEIIAAIAAYLEQETYFSETLIKGQKTRQFMRINILQSHKDFCQEVATEIAAAIAPLVEAVEPDWEDAPEWAQWRTVDKDRGVTFWSSRPEPKNGYWRMGKDGGQFEFSRYDVNWGNKIQQRPK